MLTKDTVPLSMVPKKGTVPLSTVPKKKMPYPVRRCQKKVLYPVRRCQKKVLYAPLSSRPEASDLRRPPAHSECKLMTVTSILQRKFLATAVFFLLCFLVIFVLHIVIMVRARYEHIYLHTRALLAQRPRAVFRRFLLRWASSRREACALR